mgnify:CR=1 FL=1
MDRPPDPKTRTFLGLIGCATIGVLNLKTYKQLLLDKIAEQYHYLYTGIYGVYCETKLFSG